MRLELWQIPVLIMAGLIILEAAGGFVARRWRRPGTGTIIRVLVHASLVVAATGLFVFTFFSMGTSTSANLTTLASLVLDAVAVRLTYKSIQQHKNAKADKDAGGPKAAGPA